ncbi:MAG: hypothetical protein PUC79_07660 [Prevotellaceae bacterium]|nr:hypothetical protein [Prevotellaceae bacterium]
MNKYLVFCKRDIAIALFTTGIAINIFASIHVMYFWMIEAYCSFVTMPLFIMSVLLSRSSRTPIFIRTDFLLPTLLSLIVQYYHSFVNAQNIVPFIISTASLCMFYCMFSIDKEIAEKSLTKICKVFAGFLIISILFFFLHFIGVNLPNMSAERGNYSYTNFFFFLLDDRELWNILIPRFNSVFLEPGHMGTTIIMLLATQIGKWRKWYNVVLFVAMLMSFSLAAYCLGVMLLFLRLWMLRRKIVLKILGLLSFLGIIVGGSFVYNDGDNMLNNLIVMRLEVSDTGDDFKGNNRVSEDFEKEFESFLGSSDVLFGREMDYEGWGNSGYRVYIYDYGMAGFALFLVFYFFAFRTGRDIRAITTAFVLAMTNFWIRGYPMLFAFLYPYFIISQMNQKNDTLKEQNNDATKEY